METTKVNTIIRPYNEKIMLDYTVGPDDKIMYAVELMVENCLECIAVVQDEQIVGIVRLEDAFDKLGLRIPCKKL